MRSLLGRRSANFILITLLLLLGSCNRTSQTIPSFTNFLQHPEALVKTDGIPEFDELIGELTKIESPGRVPGGMQPGFNQMILPPPPQLSPLAGEHRNTRRGFKWEWTKPIAFKVMLPQAPVLAFEWGFAGVDTIEGGFRFTMAVSQGRVEKIVSELSGQADEIRKDPNWGFAKVSLEGFHPGDALVTFKLDGVSGEVAKQTFILSAPRVFSSLNAAPRRIILIGVDTLRADHMSCYGYKLPTTPNIDTWAQGGTRYSYCVSASPWTFPSFASIFTGRYPTVCGATTATRFLPGAETTLAEILSREGFTTFAMITSFFVSPVYNIHQGFDGVEHFELAPCEDIFARARKWLDAHKQEDVFLFLHFMDPHTPYRPPLEFGRMYYPEYDGNEVKTRWDLRRSDILGGAPPVTIEDIKLVETQRALYDGEITYLDDQFGKFIQYLASNGMEDGSLIVFCSDHGEEFLEHGRTEHGKDLYDEVLHVPLIIHGSGFFPGKVIDSLTATVDIFPTILGFLNIQIPEGLNGRSLLSSNDSERILISDELLSGELQLGLEQKAATTEEYRYIFHVALGEEELYDLSDDKPMLASVAADRRSTCGGFKAFLISYIEKLSSPWRVVFSAVEQGNLDTVYSGSINCPGGFVSVEPYRFEKNDKYEIKGETLSFELGFGSTREKEIRFKPNREGVDVGFEFNKYGEPLKQGGIVIGPNSSAVNEHTFTLNLNDARFEFSDDSGNPTPWGGIIIYATPLRYREQVQPDLTPEMVEELRSLGYLN